MSTSGYEQAQRDGLSGRALEARALTRCAMILNDALVSKNAELTYEAVRMNSRLWLFFYSEIESKRVTLPIEVERNIVALATYVIKVAPRAFAGEEKVLETLISINRNIAGGLYSGADADGAAAESGPPPGGSSVSTAV